MSLRVLVVDDQRGPRRSLTLLLKNAGMLASEAASATEALTKMEQMEYDVLLTDLRMDGMSGMDLLRRVKVLYPQLPVILITAYATIETAVEAMRLGASDYLAKPYEEEEVLEKIEQARSLSVGVPVKKTANQNPELIAASAVMRAVLIRVDRIVCTELNILITGETGTGKSLLAGYIHQHGVRASKPFVSINCASLPEQLLESELFGHIKGSFTGATESRKGLFEEADTGTIFLDEIDTLSPAMQAKLLSVLQEKVIRRIGANQQKTLDIRVITAANRELPALIESGEFRSDLYYRVNGYHIKLPPLRERMEDVELLLEFLLEKYAVKYNRRNIRISPQAMEKLTSYPFPGNVRQLESMVEQMVVFSDAGGFIDLYALPEELLQQSSRSGDGVIGNSQSLSLADNEQQIIEAALDRYDSLTEAAHNLGIGRTTLWRKLRQYNIHRDRRSVYKQRD